jgi:hypothetical protein
MNISIVIAIVGVAGVALMAFVWFSPGNRLSRWAKQAHRWDYATANARFQEARRTVVAQLRHPEGVTGQALSDAAFLVAVACTDRINQLNGKEHGVRHHERIRGNLMRTFQREAEYWVAGEYGIDALGSDQEPALFARQRNQHAGLSPH